MDQEQLRILEQFTNELRLTTEELDDFKNSLKVLGPAFSKIVDPLGNLTNNLKDASTVTKRKADAEKVSTEVTASNTKAKEKNKHVTEALSEAQSELRESTGSLKAAIGSLGEGVAQTAIAFGDALLSGKEGAGKYADAVGKAGDMALDLGSKFGIIGTIIGGLIKAGTKVVEMQLKQADEQRKAIVELGKLGAAGQFTSKQMIELSQAAEIPISQFQNFLGPLKNMGTAITAIGDSAKQSTENFAKLQNVGGKTREAFDKIGVTAPELTQSFADYITLQKASGRVIRQQEVDNGNLQKAALRYTLQMQELSDLTGLSVEQAKKEMQETQNTIQMAVISFQRGEKLAQLEERRIGKTGEELAQINKTIELHKQQDIALEKVNATMAAIGGGGKEAGAAMQQFLVGGGISEEAGRKFTQLGMNLNKYREQFQQGEFDQAQFMDEYRDAIRKRIESTGTAIINAGADAANLAKQLGVSQEEILWAQANATRDTAQAIKDGQDARTEMMESEALDPIATNLARFTEIERQSQLMLERGIDATNILYQGTVPAFTDAAEQMTKVLQALTVALGGLLAVVGAGAAVKGTKALFEVIGKTAGSGILGKAGSALGRFGRFIPGVGMVVSAGLAAKGAFDASTDVEGTLGLEEGQRPTVGQRVAAGAAGALSGFSFGLIDAKTIGGFLNESLGLGDSTEDLGITEELKTEAKVVSDLTHDLQDTTTSLDKFALELTNATHPVTDFSNAMKKANDSLSQSLFGNVNMGAAGMPFTSGTSRNFSGSSVSGGATQGSPYGQTGSGASTSVARGSMARGDGFISRIMNMFGFGGESELPIGTSFDQRMVPGPDSKLLDFIAKYESNGNYNILVGGKTKTDPPLTDMTVAEVLEFQKSMLGMGHETTALGKYQIIRGTLQGLVNRGDISLEDKFDPMTQDKAAIALLDVRGRERFRSGNIDVATYANNIAKEWASMPMPSGQSYYAGVGSNKAHADREDFISAITAKMGGIAKGPESGYPATLHGNEIIVPLNANSILAELGKKTTQQAVSDMANQKSSIVTTMENDGMKDILRLNQNLMEMLSDKLDNVISKLDTSNDTQFRLLRYSQT